MDTQFKTGDTVELVNAEYTGLREGSRFEVEGTGISILGLPTIIVNGGDTYHARRFKLVEPDNRACCEPTPVELPHDDFLYVSSEDRDTVDTDLDAFEDGEEVAVYQLIRIGKVKRNAIVE